MPSLPPDPCPALASQEKTVTSPVKARTTAGRPLGQRALQTRQLLVSTTLDLIGEASYRDVTVVQIARAAGTSPATFYQYFAGVDEVVLDSVDTLARKTRNALSEFADGSWSKEGLPGAHRLVNTVLNCWSGNRAVIRTLSAVAAEADPRFVRAFKALTRPVTLALAPAVERPMPSAAGRKALVQSLVTMLVSSAAGQHQATLAVSNKAQREGLANAVYASVAVPTDL